MTIPSLLRDDVMQTKRVAKFNLCNSLILSGEYRNRTDDLLTARE